MYDECGHEEECGREAVARALLRVDTEMSEKAAAAVSESCARELMVQGTL